MSKVNVETMFAIIILLDLIYVVVFMVFLQRLVCLRELIPWACIFRNFLFPRLRSFSQQHVRLKLIWYHDSGNGPLVRSGLAGSRGLAVSWTHFLFMVLLTPCAQQHPWPFCMHAGSSDKIYDGRGLIFTDMYLQPRPRVQSKSFSWCILKQKKKKYTFNYCSTSSHGEHI